MSPPPSHIVVSLTIATSKLESCYGERLLNLWMKKRNVSFDHITDTPKYDGLNHLQTKLDDKSGTLRYQRTIFLSFLERPELFFIKYLLIIDV